MMQLNDGPSGRCTTHDKMKWMQTPLPTPITPELQAPGFGHRDAVTAICITDTGLVMSASLDKSLCVFDVNRYQETYRHVHKAHCQGVVSVAHDAVNNWYGLQHHCRAQLVLLQKHHARRTLVYSHIYILLN